TSIFKNSHPAVKKDFLDQKPKNPVTQKISFLHGTHQVLRMATRYSTEFILKQLLEYCGPAYTRDILRLKVAVLSQREDLYTLDSVIENIHDYGCTKEDVDKGIFRNAYFLKEPHISRCPCRNNIYFHYYRKLEKCLTKDNVAFNSKHLHIFQRLRSKRTFALTLQKCADALSVRNTKQYSRR
ncbi:hypothetical protein BgiMline_020707, partial [Biomphalaria glabrata]